MYAAIQKLRLLARWKEGEVDRQIEQFRLRLLDCYFNFQDGLASEEDVQPVMQSCLQVIARNQQQISLIKKTAELLEV